MTDISYYDDAHRATIACQTLLAQTRERMRYMAKYLHDGDILDIGCGLGLLADYCHRTAYVGVDRSSVAITYAIENTENDNAAFYFDDIRKMCPQRCTYYDIVFAEILEHLERPKWILEKFSDVAFHYLITLPVDMPQEPSHVKGIWSEQDVCDLIRGIGGIRDLHKFGGPQNESWWLCAVDVE